MQKCWSSQILVNLPELNPAWKGYNVFSCLLLSIWRESEGVLIRPTPLGLLAAPKALLGKDFDAKWLILQIRIILPMPILEWDNNHVLLSCTFVHMKHIRKGGHQTNSFWAPRGALKYPWGRGFNANSKMRQVLSIFQTVKQISRGAHQTGLFGVPKVEL